MLVYRISGTNLNVGESLTQFVKDRITNTENKYLGELISCDVTVTKFARGLRFKITIKVTCKQGYSMVSSIRHKTAYGAFNLALNQISHQMHKTKTKMHDNKPVNELKDTILDQHNAITTND